MNRQGNTYTFVYAIVLVVVVAALLSIIALSLQPAQNENIKNEKRQNILRSVNILSTASESEKLFNQYITEQFIVNSKGERLEGLQRRCGQRNQESMRPAAVARIRCPDGKRDEIHPALIRGGTLGADMGLCLS